MKRLEDGDCSPVRLPSAALACADAPDSKLPDFLIIGAMKAGTTSLARYFMAHPQVFMAAGKEVHYFDRHFERGMQWYAEHFSESTTHRAIGEATPNYLYSKEVIRRMASTIPNAKLIAILRNPVDRAYSHYWHERARGRETLEFERAIAAESERLTSPDLEVRTHFSYLDQGRYIGQLVYVTKHFPRGALHVILFEDLRQEPVSTFKSLCRFIEVDDTLVPENIGKRYNDFVAFRSLAIRGLAQELSSRPHGLRLLGRVLGRLNVRRVPYPPLNPELRAKLVLRYREANQALSSWLGRKLSHWDH
jgi:hypothetical protein